MDANHVDEMFAHLLHMAQDPCFKAHAWHRANEMAAECPELYGAFPDRLIEAMGGQPEVANG